MLFDFRNHGQSSGDLTTLGVREVRDLQAVVDWLERTKSPPSIGVLGVSMGGAAAIDEAAADDRVSAVILDSTHATLVGSLQRQLESRSLPLALPGAWAILLGACFAPARTSSVADPVQAIAGIGDRPVLIVEAGDDDAVGPADAAELADAAPDEGAHVGAQDLSEGQARGVDRDMLVRVRRLDAGLPRSSPARAEMKVISWPRAGRSLRWPWSPAARRRR